MTPYLFRLFLAQATVLFAIAPVALSQANAADVSAALIGNSISPGIEIAYAGDSPSRSFVNDRQSSTPVKTEVSLDGREKFKISEGFLSVDADAKRSFYAGTQFKIAQVKLNKRDVELILAPVPDDGHLGDVKLSLGEGYTSKPTSDLVAEINQLLELGKLSATAPKKGAPTGLIRLDCTYRERMIDPRPVEVVFDEGTGTASLQNVGKPLPMQPAKFTDDLIKWNNGAPGEARAFYTLSRSTGELTELFADRSNAVSLTCTLKAKKF